MKKLIVAAAGLMLTGFMVSDVLAEAGVSFKGDGRARGLYRQDYNFVDSDTSQWQSRVRFVVSAESKGGAYAFSRIRIADSVWDGTQRTRQLGEGTNIYTDWGYVGTPIGPVAVEGGLLPVNFTKFAFWDNRADGLNIKYTTDMTKLMAFYHKVDEFDETDTITIGDVTINNDIVNDDDRDRYGLYLDQKFDGGWGLVAAAWYENDDQGAGERDGFAVAGEVTGAIGTVAVLGDFAYREADLQPLPLVFGTEDDSWGLYGQAAMPVGAANLAIGVGATMDGFVADGDFGPFIMLSDVSNIATAYNIGLFGDTTFVAVVPSFKATEQLTLTGVFAYADIDGIDADSAVEISGSAAYAVTDGATLVGEAGYLDVDGLEEPAIGAGLTLNITF